MENGNGIKSCWERAKSVEREYAPLTEKDLRTIAASRVRKQFKTVSEYVWAYLVYQIILYSFLAHTLIRGWGDARTMFLCLAGGALYVPLTVALLRRVRTLFGISATLGSSGADLLRAVEQQHSRLKSFLRFKKRMDWIGVPVSCAVIVSVTLTLFGGGTSGNVLPAVMIFAIWIGLSIAAIRSENKKRFTAPLHHLELLIKDLKGQ